MTAAATPSPQPSREAVRADNARHLGELIDVEHPTRSGIGWLPGVGAGLALSLPWIFSPAYPALSSLTGAALLLVSFALVFLLLTAIVSETLFLEHRLYDNGLMLGSRLPLTPWYVVPLETLDPGSVAVEPPARIPKGQSGQVKRAWRHAGTRETVQFTAIKPGPARRLAKGKISWAQACAELADLPLEVRSRSMDATMWSLSYRDADAGAARLAAALIARS